MNPEYTRGSENVFKDLECWEPNEKLAKAELVFIINRILQTRQLTQGQAAEILGVDQPKISALKHGKLSGFSIERLLSFLKALDQRVEIVVQDRAVGSHDEIHVAYA